MGNIIKTTIETKTFTNDWHVVFEFGKYKGMKLMDVPTEYYDWCTKTLKYGPVFEAINRIDNRMEVTTLCKKKFDIPSYMPNLVEDKNKLPPIYRPKDVNPSLYGSFIEYLIKHTLGIINTSDVDTYLAQFGLSTLPTNLCFRNDVIIRTPTKREKYMKKSLDKTDKIPLDLCNLSFAHALNLDHFDEEDAAQLFRHVLADQQYYINYCTNLPTFEYIPTLINSEQETCDKISVGCIIGVIDAIAGNTIIDIKCCINDDIEYYRKQLFAYACLHKLRYGNVIKQCKIFNFLTGGIYVMDVSKVSYANTVDYVRGLGSYNTYHIKLFDEDR